MAAEKQFENKIKAYLKSKGAWFVKYWAGKSYDGKTYTKSGIPDLLVCYKGRFIAIEVKADNGHPTDLPLYNLRKIEAAGGKGFLLYPKDWESFKQYIESL